LKGQFISFCKAGLAIISSRNHRILSRNVRKSKSIIEKKFRIDAYGSDSLFGRKDGVKEVLLSGFIFLNE